MNIAQTILQQLGGSRFVKMTGAKDLLGDENSLLFRLPERFARDGINKVRITLDLSDTYTITFLKCNFRKHEFQIVAERSGIYFDMLQPVFTEVTGLDTSL
jgi:hypothetical protein